MSIKKLFARLKKSDNLKAGLLRWWIAGACYFLVGFGTQLGTFGSPIDLIFALGTIIGLATVFVYDPIANSAFTLIRRGEVVNHSYKKLRGAKKAAYNLMVIAKNMAAVFAIYIIYQQINILIVQMKQLPEGTVVFPGEPFGFATLYVLIFFLAEKLYDKFIVWKQKNRSKSS